MAMLKDCIDWPGVERAATPSPKKVAFFFCDEAKDAICAALIDYVDAHAADLRGDRTAGSMPAVAALGPTLGPAVDTTLARRIQHCVAALCAAARLGGSSAVAPARFDIDLAALDREAGKLSEIIRRAAPRAPSPEAVDAAARAPFRRFVLTIADVYVRAGGRAFSAAADERSGGAVELEGAQKGRQEGLQGEPQGDGDAESARSTPRLDRAFVKFLRALLLDAREVLLGLPSDATLEQSDGAFSRAVSLALAPRGAAVASG